MRIESDSMAIRPSPCLLPVKLAESREATMTEETNPSQCRKRSVQQVLGAPGHEGFDASLPALRDDGRIFTRLDRSKRLS